MFKKEDYQTMDKPSIRVRKLLLRSYLSFSLPAIVLLLTFSLFTVQRQINSETQSYQDMLSIYSNDIDRVLQNTASQLDSLIYESTSFQLFSFASKNTVHNNINNCCNIYIKLLSHRCNINHAQNKP